MRMLFSSSRLENVEFVQKLFVEAGIECKIIGGRSYKSFSRRGFSYNNKFTSDETQSPQLWVTRADDYRQAREIMLEQGLLASQQDPTFIPNAVREKTRASNPNERLNKTRMLLLILTIGAIFVQGLRLLFQ